MNFAKQLHKNCKIFDNFAKQSQEKFLNFIKQSQKKSSNFMITEKIVDFENCKFHRTIAEKYRESRNQSLAKNC